MVRALDSLRAQTFADFVVVMSDDISSDDTASIAEKYCLSDNRFTLVRQSRNLNYGNFRYVLSTARTEYFMFAAGDDVWEPTFVEACISAIRNDPRAVCAVPRVKFVVEDGTTVLAKGTRPLSGSPAENICDFLTNYPDDNSRMYGVLRTAVAQGAFPVDDHHAWDHTFSIGTLLCGTRLEVRQRLMVRETTPYSKYMESSRESIGDFVEGSTGVPDYRVPSALRLNFCWSPDIGDLLGSG